MFPFLWLKHLHFYTEDGGIMFPRNVSTLHGVIFQKIILHICLILPGKPDAMKRNQSSSVYHIPCASNCTLQNFSTEKKEKKRQDELMNHGIRATKKANGIT